MPLVTTMLIMQIASIMNAGFDPIINLYNDSVKDVADTIDTFVYSTLTSSSAGSARAYGIATAVGLFKNVVNFILLIFANYWTKKINGYSMYTLD